MLNEAGYRPLSVSADRASLTPRCEPAASFAAVGIAGAREPKSYQLDATYYDTAGLDLLRSMMTLRRRTGGPDAGGHSAIASVVERATGRAVCLALAAALARFGVPDEILTDNGKQFTSRFGRGGEVLFDKICRHNGITHRLTQPASPTTTGKIERFHLTLRRELLDDHPPFESLPAAQDAVDEFVRGYNVDRPHQALDAERPVAPADRFTPTGGQERELLPLWLPPTLDAASPACRTNPSPMKVRSPNW